MIKIPPVPVQDNINSFVWLEWFRTIRDALYSIPENKSDTGPPTTGYHTVGEFYSNTTPTEFGMIGSKYIIFGWVCVADGTPGTWKECRTLTGK